MTVPKPGVYEGIPEKEYHSWDAFSYSCIKHLLRSPLHLWHYLQNGQVQTDYMKRGSLLDFRVFTPEEYARRYTVLPRFEDHIRRDDGTEYSNPKNTKKYREMVERFKHESGGAELLSEELFQQIEAMALSCEKDADGKVLLDAPGINQLSIVFEDEETGVLCKSRLDKYTKDVKTVVDLKATFRADEGSFINTIAKFKYYAQAAMYLRACKAHDLPAEYFIWLVVEWDAPHAVACYQCDFGALEAGDAVVTHALKNYRHWKNLDIWPGYPKEFPHIGLPNYEFDRVMQRYS